MSWPLADGKMMVENCKSNVCEEDILGSTDLTRGVQETLQSWTCGDGSGVVVGVETGQVSRNHVMKGLLSMKRSSDFTFEVFSAFS